MANNEKIQDMNTDWQGYSGQSVQGFIKEQISKAFSDIGGKAGHATYAGGRMTFFDTQGGKQLFTVELTGTNYTINSNPSIPPNSEILALVTDTQSLITIRPTTQQFEFGNPNPVDYYEPYTYSVTINNEQVSYGNIGIGESASVDIKPFLSLASTKIIDISITGSLSGQTTRLMYRATLTSMAFTCNHTWQNAWVGENQYTINNIRYSGNLVKNIYVRIYNRELGYDKTYVSEDYEGEVVSPDVTNFTLLSEWHPETSGVYDMELWLQAKEGGSKTPSVYTKLMYVTAEDKDNISLICVNNKPSVVYNFKEETLLQYAVFNIASVTSRVDADDNGKLTNIVPESTTDVQNGIIYTLRTSLKIETSNENGVYVVATITSDNASSVSRIIVDNKYAYLSVSGYNFLLNPSANSNSGSNKNKVLNSADGSFINAVWDKFTFADDAWGSDTNGNRALVVKAGSTLSIPTLKPLASSQGGACTVEFLFKASNISDENSPIMTCIDTEEVTEQSTGLIVYPTKVVLFSNKKREELLQQLPLSEDTVHHILISIQPQVQDGKGLASIYINGTCNAVFDYDGTDGFINNEEGALNYLRMGQGGTDMYLYLMRIYNNRALSSQQAFANYLNAVIEYEFSRDELKTLNDIAIEGNISYEKCKARGLNCFIVKTKNDVAIPYVGNSKERPVDYIRLEYGDHPEWNVTIEDTVMDSQGTTSSKYYRHNLRSKVPSTAKWHYPNRPDVEPENGKEGYVAGYGLTPPVSKITWKKNVASQPQGHKMGATAMYNALWQRIFGNDELLPNKNNRVAVYQYPFMGFQEFSDGSYKFIGLYTGGPDKTDKKTFGYNETGTYPSLMMIEGPDHYPVLTRFLVPWTDDVFYDWSKDMETLSVGSINGNKEGGWDADIVGKYSSDEEKDSASVYKLYNDEFKPAYDAIYYCSPYIAYVGDAKYKSVEEINSHITDFRNSTTRVQLYDETYETFSNTLMSFFDDNGNIIYYYPPTSEYRTLPLDTHDMKKYLNLETLTTFEVQKARAAKWKEEVFRYVNKGEALYRQCFGELMGISDNDAKNSYWRKFLAVKINKDTGENEGGKWGFNEDDMDTIFQNDNNGQDTKSYYVEPDDVSINGADIFQGRTSAFWYALRLYCKNDMRDMMVRIVNAMEEEVKDLGNIKATTLHERVFLLIKHYFWDYSSKYFPATAYNADTKYAYTDVWMLDTGKAYNGVAPLTQVHGDHYETEKAWVEKRIAYMFSKYRIGGFDVGEDGWGSLATTIANSVTINVTPAIWLYPRYSKGAKNPTDSTSARTPMGESYPLSISGVGDTNTYIPGLDWMSSLGDLSDVKLSSRSTSDNITFEVTAKRLRDLVVGKENGTPLFNATRLNVTSPSLELIDARNVSTLTESISLLHCPRLRSLYLSGTNIVSIQTPEGGRLEVLDLPSTIKALALNKQNLLEEENLSIPEDAFANISTLYLNNCNHINPLNMLAKIYNASNGTKPNNLGLVWSGSAVSLDAKNIVMLGAIANKAGKDGGFFGCEWQNGSAINTNTPPLIYGTLDCTRHPVYISDVEAIEKVFEPNLKIEYSTEEDKLYQEFEDVEVRKIVAEQVGDGAGVKVSAWPSISTASLDFLNANIVSFPEYGLLRTRQIHASAFMGCAQLTTITLPHDVDGNGILLKSQAFSNCKQLQELICQSHIKTNENATNSLQVFYGSSKIKTLKFPNINSLLNSSYMSDYDHPFPTTMTRNGTYYVGGIPLTQVEIPENYTHLNPRVLANSVWDTINFNQIKTIDTAALAYSTIRHLELPNSLTEIGANAFRFVRTDTTTVVIPNTVTYVGERGLSFHSPVTIHWKSDIDIPTECVYLVSTTSYGVKRFIVDSLTKTIQSQAFDCATLELIDLPATITNIKSRAFYCAGVIPVNRTLICRAETPPSFTINSYAEESSFMKLAKIYVPDSSVSKYKSATGWKSYSTKIFPLSDYVEPTE